MWKERREKIGSFKYENMKTTPLQNILSITAKGSAEQCDTDLTRMWSSSCKSPLSGKQGQSYSSEHAVIGKSGFI